jgi:hypothetical protein
MKFVEQTEKKCDSLPLTRLYTVDSKFQEKSKLRVFATEPFLTGKSTETSENSTEVSGENN